MEDMPLTYRQLKWKSMRSEELLPTGCGLLTRGRVCFVTTINSFPTCSPSFPLLIIKFPCSLWIAWYFYSFFIYVTFIAFEHAILPLSMTLLKSNKSTIFPVIWYIYFLLYRFRISATASCSHKCHALPYPPLFSCRMCSSQNLILKKFWNSLDLEVCKVSLLKAGLITVIGECMKRYYSHINFHTFYFSGIHNGTMKLNNQIRN